MSITPRQARDFVQNYPPGARLRITNLARQTELASQAEAAIDSATRRKGLLGRSGLPAGGGLWIVPCESVHTWFMRFPIDLVYIDRNLVVKKVRHSVGPWRISACLAAHSILELPAGVIQSSLTEPGDQLEFAFLEASASEPTPPIRLKDANSIGNNPDTLP
jgi:hypothetical protein